MPDTNEALGQNVEQKPPHELLRGDGHDSGLVAARIVPPTKRDVAAVEGKETVVGDGDTMSVASEVADHVRGAAEGGLGVDNPVLAKQCSKERREALGFCQVLDRSRTSQWLFPMSATQSIHKLCPEDLAERLNGEEERVARVNPPFLVRRDSAAWNDAVNVGMKH